MQGYDLDDTLAAVDFAQARHRPMEQIFAQAEVIYVPTTDFVIITGRPHTTSAQRTATLAWLHRHQPKFRGIHYVDTSTPRRTAQVKAAVIKRLSLSDYTDNNPDVLNELAPLVDARLWRMHSTGKRVAHRGVDRAALARRWAPTLHLRRP